jgi:hypothetical protein
MLLDTGATLIDETLDLHDRLIGSFFTKAKHWHEREFAAAGKAINDKVRLYARIGGALVDARHRVPIRSSRSKQSCRGTNLPRR